MGTLHLTCILLTHLHHRRHHTNHRHHQQSFNRLAHLVSSPANLNLNISKHPSMVSLESDGSQSLTTRNPKPLPQLSTLCRSRKKVSKFFTLFFHPIINNPETTTLRHSPIRQRWCARVQEWWKWWYDGQRVKVQRIFETGRWASMAGSKDN